MKVFYLKQLLKQAFLKGTYYGKNNGRNETIGSILKTADEYANEELDFLDLTDKEEVA